MADRFACSDPLAERRYLYARAAAKDGDWAVAAQMLEQTLERAPAWPPALFALGDAREKLGDRAAAVEAFGACRSADPADSHGAGARLALLGEGGAARGLPSAYIAELFDEYAPRFDRHLTEDLAYRGPALIVQAIDAAAPGRRFQRALDLGCGTGLAGVALRERVERLEGIDLSPAMVAKARQRGLYDALDVGEIVDGLQRRTRQFDLLVAADALIYFGDLSALFRAAAAALTPGGVFVFTLETHSGEGYRLGPSLRFAHARAYVEAEGGAAGLTPLIVTPAWARREAGAEVSGLTAAFALEAEGAEVSAPRSRASA